VALWRTCDAAVIGLFLMMLSGVMLLVFQSFHFAVTVTHKAKLNGYGAWLLEKAVPTKGKQLSFDLTHVLIFAIVACLFAMNFDFTVVKKRKKKHRGIDADDTDDDDDNDDNDDDVPASKAAADASE